MPAFCSNCGKPMPPEVSFCANCGASSGQPGQPAPAPQHPPAAAGVPAKSSGLGKILLIGGGVFLLLGLLAIGGLIYAGYKLKHKAAEVAREYNFRTGEPAGPPARRTEDVCSLLTKEEVAAITAIPVERTESGHNRCSYFGDTGAAQRKSAANVNEALGKLQNNEPKNEQDARKVMEQLTKGLTSGAAAAGSGLLFTVTVNWGQASEQEMAYRIAMKAMTSKMPVQMMENLQGVGDRAYLAPMGSGLYVVKGDTWIEVDARTLGSRQEAIEIAKKIVSRL